MREETCIVYRRDLTRSVVNSTSDNVRKSRLGLREGDEKTIKHELVMERDIRQWKWTLTFWRSIYNICIAYCHFPTVSLLLRVRYSKILILFASSFLRDIFRQFEYKLLYSFTISILYYKPKHSSSIPINKMYCHASSIYKYFIELCLLPHTMYVKTIYYITQ